VIISRIHESPLKRISRLLNYFRLAPDRRWHNNNNYYTDTRETWTGEPPKSLSSSSSSSCSVSGRARHQSPAAAAANAQDVERDTGKTVKNPLKKNQYLLRFQRNQFATHTKKILFIVHCVIKYVWSHNCFKTNTLFSECVCRFGYSKYAVWHNSVFYWLHWITLFFF